MESPLASLEKCLIGFSVPFLTSPGKVGDIFFISYEKYRTLILQNCNERPFTESCTSNSSQCYEISFSVFTFVYICGIIGHENSSVKTQKCAQQHTCQYRICKTGQYLQENMVQRIGYGRTQRNLVHFFPLLAMAMAWLFWKDRSNPRMPCPAPAQVLFR